MLGNRRLPAIIPTMIGSPRESVFPAADPPLPLLVTGVAGVAGFNAWHYFRRRYPGQVAGIRQRDNERLTGEGLVACDVEDRTGLERLFDAWGFRSVLNCAGNCALRACELDTRLAWRTNVEGLIALGSVVACRDVRLVHTSVDLVYAGRPAGDYREEDPTDPVTVYGKTMVAAETMLTDWLPASCILRISLPMGVSFNGHAGAIDWIQSRFAKGRPATLYVDEVRTPTYVGCLNRVFQAALAGSFHGIFHAGGPRALSLFEIAQIVSRVGGYDPRLLRGCPRSEAGPIPPRAGNVAMNSRRLAEALGTEPFLPWPADPAWLPNRPDWHFDRAGTPGSFELLAATLYGTQQGQLPPTGGPPHGRVS